VKINDPLNCIGIHREKGLDAGKGLDVGKLKTGGFVFVAYGEKKHPFIVVLDDEAARRLGQFLLC